MINMTELRETLDEWIKAQHFDDTPETERKIEDKIDELFKQYVEAEGQHEAEVYEAYADNLGYDLIDVEDWMTETDDAYAGEYYSEEEFAEEMLEETGELHGLPNLIRYNLDWAGIASELMYDYFESHGYYFRNI